MSLRALAFIAAVLGLDNASARTIEPVANFENLPVRASMNAEQVRETIVAVGAAIRVRPWAIIDGGAGKLVGRLNVRKHEAVVEISYSASQYSITYLNSSELSYRDGSINAMYNVWVRELQGALDRALSSAPASSASTRAQANAIAVFISGEPGIKRSRRWPTLIDEWNNQMDGAVDSVGALLLTVREGEPVAMGKPGTLIAVRVNSFRLVGAARPYTRPPAFQGRPTNASLDVTVRFFDLMTGDPVGIERAYSASARDADPQSTNLQVRNIAHEIMADWRASTVSEPTTPKKASAPASGADRADASFWESVRDSKDPAALRAYLDRFPNGVFAPLARARLDALAR